MEGADNYETGRRHYMGKSRGKAVGGGGFANTTGQGMGAHARGIGAAIINIYWSENEGLGVEIEI